MFNKIIETRNLKAVELTYIDGTIFFKYDLFDANDFICEVNGTYDLYFGLCVVNNVNVTNETRALFGATFNTIESDLIKLGVI